MPIQDGKYVTPAWQNGGPPAITAEELTAIGQSIEQNQTDIEENATNIQSANSSIQQNAQDIESLQTWQTTVNGQISSIQNGYLQKSGGTMTGAINMNNNKITNIPTPTAGADAVNKSYVDNNFDDGWKFVETKTFTVTGSAKTFTENFNSIFSSFQNGYSEMLVKIYGSLSWVNPQNPNFSIFGNQIIYPNNSSFSLSISQSSPIILRYNKGYVPSSNIGVYYFPITNSGGMRVGGLDGTPNSYTVSIATNAGTVNGTMYVQFYGKNSV